jgi:hypothetical protein
VIAVSEWKKSDPTLAGVQRAAVQGLHWVTFMETRELYKQKFEAQIHEWGARLEDAKVRLQAIAATTDHRWDDMKKSSDQAWHDVKAAFGGANDAFKPGDPGKKPS